MTTKGSNKGIEIKKLALTMKILDKYMGSNMSFISSISFTDTKGERCEYVFKGGFKVSGIDGYVFYDLEDCLFPALEETVDESLIDHYTKFCHELLTILNEGIDARKYDTVTFAFIFNREKSLSTPNETIASYDFSTDESIPKDSKGLFYMNPRAYNFYDFVIKIKKGNKEDIYNEFKGIPHFIVPAFMKTIGIWLGFAE